MDRPNMAQKMALRGGGGPRKGGEKVLNDFSLYMMHLHDTECYLHRNAAESAEGKELHGHLSGFCRRM